MGVGLKKSMFARLDSICFELAGTLPADSTRSDKGVPHKRDLNGFGIFSTLFRIV